MVCVVVIGAGFLAMVTREGREDFRADPYEPNLSYCPEILPTLGTLKKPNRGRSESSDCPRVERLNCGVFAGGSEDAFFRRSERRF